MERQGKALTITQHFGELRRRLLISVGAVAMATGVSFIFAKQLFRILIAPAGDIDLIYIEMTEMLGTYMKVALFSGLALALPVLLYQIIAFLKPALLSRERKYLYLMLCGATVCFIGGVLFGYFVLLPPAMHFLLSFGADIAAPQIKIGAYVSLVVRLLFFIGLSFETPAQVGHTAGLRSWRHYHTYLRPGQSDSGGSAYHCAIRVGYWPCWAGRLVTASQASPACQIPCWLGRRWHLMLCEERRTRWIG